MICPSGPEHALGRQGREDEDVPRVTYPCKLDKGGCLTSDTTGNQEEKKRMRGKHRKESQQEEGGKQTNKHRPIPR